MQEDAGSIRKRKIPGEENTQPLPVLLPGKTHWTKAWQVHGVAKESRFDLATEQQQHYAVKL